MSFFSVSHLTAGYGNGHVIQNVSFALNSGCLMGILGANGSGKTTLLKAICGNLPHTGSTTLDGCVPESALDFRYRYRMLEILRKWIEKEEKAAIVTLHDPALALNYCDQLLLLSDGEVLGTIYPQTDPLDKMEQMLSKVYGAISLQVCSTRSGRSHLVMLKEDDL